VDEIDHSHGIIRATFRFGWVEISSHGQATSSRRAQMMSGNSAYAKVFSPASIQVSKHFPNTVLVSDSTTNGACPLGSVPPVQVSVAQSSALQVKL